MYCSRGDDYSYVGKVCSSSYTSYYYLRYVNDNVQYAIYKEAALKAFTDGYLEEFVKNYVCFGTEDEKCDDEHLYRIIGVFGDQVKLIKAYEGTESSLGTTAHGDSYRNITYYKGKLETVPGYYWVEQLIMKIEIGK